MSTLSFNSLPLWGMSGVGDLLALILSFPRGGEGTC